MTIDAAPTRVNPAKHTPEPWQPRKLSKDLMLAELRAQAAWARQYQLQMDAIGVALAEDVITPHVAMLRVEACGGVLLCDLRPGDIGLSDDGSTRERG